MTQHWSCAENAEVLDKLVYKPISYKMVSYVSDVASTLIACDPNALPPTQGRFGPKPSGATAENNLLPLAQFIYHIVCRSGISTSTFLTSLVYLRRIESKMNLFNTKWGPKYTGFRCCAYRILLGSLILADKLVNDECYDNSSWAAFTIQKYEGYTFGFHTFDITTCEKQILSLLDWNVQVTMEELETELLGVPVEV
ncbi:hypothetical protein V8F33_008502 [Rhypophila sp. PSN 637]